MLVLVKNSKKKWKEQKVESPGKNGEGVELDEHYWTRSHTTDPGTPRWGLRDSAMSISVLVYDIDAVSHSPRGGLP